MSQLKDVLEQMKGSTCEKNKEIGKQMTFSDFNDKEKVVKTTLKDYSRVQSPSSINTFLSCPRQYFYRYIKKRPSRPSIHLIRGKLVHSVLEDFYDLDPEKLTASFDMEIKMILLENLKKRWKDRGKQLIRLGLSKEKLEMYLNESGVMLANFVDLFSIEVHKLLKNMALPDAFIALSPKREVYFKSPNMRVQGFVDALFEGERIKIIDYKTSKSDTMRIEYKRQLAIYALMFKEKFGKDAHEVGIHFLKHGIKMLPVTPELKDWAFKDVELVHSKTKTGHIKDYPKGEHPLCKWSTGQCDHYDICGGV